MADFEPERHVDGKFQTWRGGKLFTTAYMKFRMEFPLDEHIMGKARIPQSSTDGDGGLAWLGWS